MQKILGVCEARTTLEPPPSLTCLVLQAKSRLLWLFKEVSSTLTPLLDCASLLFLALPRAVDVEVLQKGYF